MAEAQRIRIACKGSGVARLDELEVIQGDLKDLTDENYAKLRRRIETKGFDAPLFVWQGKILDGTQRYRVLSKMIEDGWELRGGEVPICEIEADSIEQAKDRLLGYVSQYGKVTAVGLDELLEGMDESALETVNLPGVNLEAGWLRGSDGEGSSDGEAVPDGPSEPAGPVQVEVICPECGHEFYITQEQSDE